MPSIKALLAKPFARRVRKSIEKWANNPIETQEKVFQSLISEGSATVFGQDHEFVSINNHSDFVKRVPAKNSEHFYLPSISSRISRLISCDSLSSSAKASFTRWISSSLAILNACQPL